jgi:hypothetical protein
MNSFIMPNYISISFLCQFPSQCTAMAQRELSFKIGVALFTLLCDNPLC